MGGACGKHPFFYAIFILLVQPPLLYKNLARDSRRGGHFWEHFYPYYSYFLDAVCEHRILFAHLYTPYSVYLGRVALGSPGHFACALSYRAYCNHGSFARLRAGNPLAQCGPGTFWHPDFYRGAVAYLPALYLHDRGA